MQLSYKYSNYLLKLDLLQKSNAPNLHLLSKIQNIKVITRFDSKFNNSPVLNILINDKDKNEEIFMLLSLLFYIEFGQKPLLKSNINEKEIVSLFLCESKMTKKKYILNFLKYLSFFKNDIIFFFPNLSKFNNVQSLHFLKSYTFKISFLKIFYNNEILLNLIYKKWPHYLIFFKELFCYLSIEFKTTKKCYTKINLVKELKKMPFIWVNK